MDSRTTNASNAAAAELKAVLEELGIQAEFGVDADAPDLILPGDLPVEVRSSSRPTSSQLKRWGIDEAGSERGSKVVVVVADWIDPALRDQLRHADWGWLDRTGHLRLMAEGLYIDREIEPLIAPEVQRRNPLRRESGFSVAVELLARKAEPQGDTRWDLTVREVAAGASVSVGSAHKAMSELTGLGLLGEDGSPRSALFWAAAREWHVKWFPLSSAPGTDVTDTVERLLRFRLEDLDQPGWAQAGDGAAALYGAPIVADGPPRLFCPDQRALTWALRTFGEGSEERSASAFVGVPPTEAGVRHRTRHSPWPLVRPMIVALELASSGPRGREALEQWPDRPIGVLGDD